MISFLTSAYICDCVFYGILACIDYFSRIWGKFEA
jgi:hypothetical protein